MSNRDLEAEDCAALLKTLADPTRLRVVQGLLKGPQHVWEINQALDLEQSLLSHHLRVLREAGLVSSERDGKAVLYRLAPGVAGSVSRRVVDLGCCKLAFDEPEH